MNTILIAVEYTRLFPTSFTSAQPKDRRVPRLSLNPGEIFETRDDFELAEFILEAALNEDLTTRLFKIINRIWDGSSDLTYRSSRELNDIWQLASATDIPVSITNPLPEVQALKYG